MGFNCGIVGLPNVGKSTLFNALTQTAAAQAANYPFCTIEPNIGRVAVPDERLSILAKIAGSKQIIPTQLEFVDIAGLVKGASKGEGLGNQFLSHIRDVDAIIHVLRCFENNDITHVEGTVDPLRDAEIIEMELLLADLESLEKRLIATQKKAKGQDKEALILLPLMEEILHYLQAGIPARKHRPVDPEMSRRFDQLQLLSSKPILYVCNVEEGAAATGNSWSEKVITYAKIQGSPAVIISAAIEEEIAQLSSDEERSAFLSDLGLLETGLSRIIKVGYELLNLITFFTVGPKETHAWTLLKGLKAPAAAGVIHTDFERGFIRAETIAYADYVTAGGEAKAREAGKLRTEGKDYLVKDGDIFHFLFNT